MWTWSRLWASLPFSFATTDACMRACKKKGLREAFVTLWGDDGGECDLWSALPGILYFAEHGHADAADEGRLRGAFQGICGGSWDDWVRASAVNALPGKVSSSNLGKALLWQDPLLAMLDPYTEGVPARAHFHALAAALSKAARNDGRLEFPAQIARVLSLKVDLRRQLASGDREVARRVLDGDLKALRKAVDRLWRLHRMLWMETYRPFGFEVIEHRYGGLRARLEGLEERVRAWIAGGAGLEELEAPLLAPFQGELPHLFHSHVKTPSAIK